MREALFFLGGLLVGGFIGWGVSQSSESALEETRRRNLSEMDQQMQGLKEHTAAMECSAEKLAKANAEASQAQTIVTPI